MWLLSNYLAIQSAGQAIGIGLMWLAMTVVFEFGFGHFIVGNPWSRLLHDYNVLYGFRLNASCCYAASGHQW